MAKGKVIDGVDPVVLALGEIGSKADGGQQLEPLGGGKCGKTFDEGDDAVDTFRVVDVADEPRDAFFVPCADEDAAPGFLPQASDGFGLRQFQEGVAPKVLREMDHGGMD